MILTNFWVSCFLLLAFMKISPISFFSKYKIVYVCAFWKYSNIFFSHSKSEGGQAICLSASSLMLTIVFPSSLRYWDKSLTSRVLFLVFHQKPSPLCNDLQLLFWQYIYVWLLCLYSRTFIIFLGTSFISIKNNYMLQNSLSCKILRVIISTRVFLIQKSL